KQRSELASLQRRWHACSFSPLVVLLLLRRVSFLCDVIRKQGTLFFSHRHLRPHRWIFSRSPSFCVHVACACFPPTFNPVVFMLLANSQQLSTLHVGENTQRTLMTMKALLQVPSFGVVFFVSFRRAT